MISIASGIDESSERGVYALLALLDTPQAKERKAALDELVKSRDAAVKALVEANAKSAENVKRTSELDAREAALTKAQDSFVKESAALNAAKLAQEASVTAATAEFARGSAVLTEREVAVKAVNDRIAARESAVDARETKVTEREAAAAKLSNKAQAALDEMAAVLKRH